MKVRMRSASAMKVIAAMSGGVDSAVAAARAVAAGHDVTGVHLALSAAPATLRTSARGCCSREDAGDARRAADVLGIPFYIWDLADRFRAEVIDDFVAEYAAGRTPNPCLRCNQQIKFAAVLDRALGLGFDAVVTGHHARLADGVLRRSVDAAKDQSYVLAVLDQRQLAHSIFPLGDSTKTEVRAEAARLGLAVAAKPDSHDICFIPDGDTRAFLGRALGARPGSIVDGSRGRGGPPRGVVRLHRRAAPRARSHPTRSGRAPALRARTAAPRQHRRRRPGRGAVDRRGDRDRGRSGPMASVRVTSSTAWFRCGRTARRWRRPSAVTVARCGRSLATPQRGIAAGQALVMYDGDAVIGSATIVSAVPAGLRA